jgi:hypothetical protein
MEFGFRMGWLAVLFVTAGCGSSAKKTSQDMAPPTPLGVGHVAFMLMDDGHAHRAAATNPPIVEDVSGTLQAVSSGADSDISLSHDGKLAALITTRFGCAGFECLALVPIGDTIMASAATVVLANGQELHPSDRPAIADGGAFIVYSDSGGPHGRDLFIVRKIGAGNYGAPLLLTAASTFDFNLLPSLTRDESSLVYDCSPTGSKVQASLCKVNLDGSGWAVTLAGSAGPGADAMNEVHSGDFLPDGTTLVFEADWSMGNQRIWKRDAAGTLSQFNPVFTNDVTPCVLPDGRIVSLWLNRPGNMGGTHEPKVMTADGASFSMLMQNVDVIDTGISCSD